MIELVLIKKSRAEVGYLLVERSEALRTFWQLYNKLLKKFLGAKQVECFACLGSSSFRHQAIRLALLLPMRSILKMEPLNSNFSSN